MNKRIVTKMLSLALSLTLCLAVFGGCVGRDGHGGGKIDTTKTQLYVNTFYAGLGDDWLKRYKDEFEKFYAETSFEEGKKGVEIIIDYSYSSGYSQLEQIVSSRAEVIWGEAAKHTQIAAGGIAYPITDLIDKPLTEFGEDATIADKIEKELLDYYKAFDGNVYVLPWFDYLKGVIYDIDIFEGKQSAGHGFYIAKDGGFTNGLEGSPEKSAGPNNIPGDYDDGLPSTHDEFTDMMNEMVICGITPFTLAGSTTYVDSLFIDLWMNEEGEEALLNYTFDGTATDLIDVATDGTITEISPTQITNENAYMIYKQAGRYRAYQYAKWFVSNPSYFTEESFSLSQNHVQSLRELLYNAVDRPGKQKPAMAVNGVWWEGEANTIFQDMEAMDSKFSKANRRFGWMALPFYNQAQSGQSRQQVLATEQETCVFISKNIAPEKLDLAKKFLQFTSTDAMIVAHAEENGAPRSLKVQDISILENSEKLTTFGKSVVEGMSKSKLIYPVSTNKFQWHAGLNLHGLFNQATVGAKPYTSPTRAMYENPSLTAIDYFNGIYTTNYNKWQNLLDTYRE